MTSLTTCLKKAGDHLHPEDRAAIVARAEELRKAGKSTEEASMQAVQERIDHVLKLREAAGDGPAPKAADLSEHLRNEILAGRMPKDNPALKRLVAEFEGKEPDPARMKRAQEELEAAIVQVARREANLAPVRGDRSTFDRLLALYESQPNLNIRTSSSIANQAYSTPAPLAYLASRLTGIGKGVTVLEPTAGTGMLVMQADPAKTQANEIDPVRQGLLLDQGFDVTRRDASEPGAFKPGSFDRVIANPPFGGLHDAAGSPMKVEVDGYKLGQIDHLIAARALAAMKDDGRATLILGADKSKASRSNDARIFLNWLYSHYNVVSHFEVEGDLYQRQGAGWPVRVITVAGRVERPEAVGPAPDTITRASNWSDVYEQFDKGLAAVRAGLPAAGGASERAPVAAPVPGAADAKGGGADRARPGAGQARPGSQPGVAAGGVVDRGEQPPVAVGGRAGEQRLDGKPAGGGELERPVAGDAARARQPRADRGTSGLTSPDNQFQAKYKPRSGRADEGVLIPVNMAEPTQHALDKLEDAVGDIDQFAARELGYESVEKMHEGLMGLQVDSVASAIHQVKNGKGLIIADQTGIGKGRQAAAIIRWALKNGKVPVFLTFKPSLFTDMHGDLHDIGSDDVAPFIFNSTESIKGPAGEVLFGNRPATHRKNLERIAQTGQLPEGRNAVFLTYSQINTDNTQRKALMALAPNAVIVMDESHNAAGDSNTGEFVQEMLGLAPGAVYLSATYAKRPDNMPVYSKTDIGEAIEDKETLGDAMAAGGLPLQTVVANNLVKAGQMFRRERSYEGVSIRTVVDTKRSAEHRKLADRTTEALRAIVQADRMFHTVFFKEMQKELEKQGDRALDIAGNQAAESVNHTEFSSVVHNFVRQMLLGLKAQEAADRAIAHLKAGEKPMIALENTMGSFLTEYADANGIAVGDSLGTFDYRTVLSRALERSRAYVREDGKGNKERVKVGLNELDSETRKAYAAAQRVIDKLELAIPVSPIDWMRKQITDAGYSVKEITGRSLAVDYTDPAHPKLAAIDRAEQKDKVATTRAFNDGSLDAIILNVAGSTGISLHASEKFKDQRPRRMVVAQPAQDINIFMQMLGRIHRTGQVKLPGYTLLNVDLPAEKRPTALLSKKMKSLNANTSSNTESATSVEAADVLNKYGDQVVARYLADNMQLSRALGIEYPLGEDGSVMEDIARKATGRLALMPVAVQEQFYAEVEDQYRTLIQYLNDTNQNDLEPRTFDFDARETRSETLYEGQNPASPFGESATYGEYSIKSQGKAMTPDEILEAIKEHLEDKTPADHAAALQAKLEDVFGPYRAALEDAEDQTAADATRTAGLALLGDFPIGSMWRVEVNGDTYNAIVTNLRNTHKKGGNPFSLSKFQVTLAVNGGLRSITVPGSQISELSGSYLGRLDREALQRNFAVVEQGRETAKIVTGNLLAAYGELQGSKGTIITFTKADGTTEQGILLPKKFNFAKEVRQDYRLRTPGEVVHYLTNSSHENIDRFGVMSRDSGVRILPAGTGVTIQVPKSKAKGGKFFLDDKLRAITGDFVSSGNFMRVTVPADKAEAAVARVMQKNALYVVASMASDAKEVLASRKNADADVSFSEGAPAPFYSTVTYAVRRSFNIPNLWVAEGSDGSQHGGTEAVVREWVEDQKRNQPWLKQPGFDITPAMREQAAGGVPLFADAPQGSVGNVPNPSTKASALAEVRSLFGHRADGVVTVVEDAADLPDGLRQRLMDNKVWGVTVAKHHVYILADRVPQGMVRGLVMHELGVHYGMRDEQIHSLTEQVVRWASGTGPYADLAKEAIRRAAASTSTAGRNEETLAYFTQFLVDKGIDPTKPGTMLGRWWQNFVQALKRAGRALGFDIPVTPQDVVDFAYGAANLALARGVSPKAAQATPAGRAQPVAAGQQHSEDLSFSEGPALASGLRKALNDASGVKLPAGYVVGDLFDRAGKLHWWHKTVGTPHHLAQKFPAFKAVYDAVQTFLNDVSLYASEAADKAPTILPKLESWRDLAKSPLSAADNKAIAAPIFEGTLLWARDGATGKPIKMDDLRGRYESWDTRQKAQELLHQGALDARTLRMWQGMPLDSYEAAVNSRFESAIMQAGIVWTPAELKAQFGLNDAQVKLYQEFREATDKSLDDLTRSELVKIAGEDAEELRDDVMAMKNVDDAAMLLRDHFFELAHQALESDDKARAKVLNGAADKIVQLANKLKGLKERGYAPLSRFGQYTLDVVGQDGARLYFGMFDSTMDRARMERTMRAEYPDATIQTGTVSQEAYRLFAGVSPETLELFGQILGLDSTGDSARDAAFQQYLQVAKSNRSAVKRLIHRKGVAGYSEDVGRVLAGFVYSNARATSGNLHMGAATRAAEDIPKQQGQLQDHAVQLLEYVKNPHQEAQGLRGLLFAQYLGGSIASAMVNALQPINVTLPYLSQYGGIAKASGFLKDGFSLAAKKDTGDAKLNAALKHAEEEGIVAPQEVHQLQAQASGRATLRSGDGTTLGNAMAKASNGWSRATLAMGKVFSVAELWNRRVTFIAAYKAAEAAGMADPAGFAAKAVADTQFTYNKGNKPKWARGAIGSVLFTFKQYSVSYLELLNRMWTQGGPEGKRAVLYSMAILFLMSGAGGLPFEDDAEDVLDAFMQRLGFNFDTKRAKHEWLAETLGEDGARFVEHGLSGLPGVPIDVSGRLGMGNLIPGSGLLTKKEDHTSDVAELAGPVADLGKRAFQSAGKLVDGDPLGAAAGVMPTSIQNALKAYDMLQTGAYRDASGKKVIDTDTLDAVAKGLGFQPGDVAKAQEADRMVQEEIGQTRQRQKELSAQAAKALYERDDEALQAVRDAIARWNENNPEAPIKPASVFTSGRNQARNMHLSKAQRLEKTAPAAMRQQVRERLEGGN